MGKNQADFLGGRGSLIDEGTVFAAILVPAAMGS